MKIATRLRVFVAKFILYFGNPWLGRGMAVRGEGGVICWKGAASRRRRRCWVSSFAHCQSHLFGGRRWVRRAVRVGGLALGPLWTTARNPHLGNSAEAVCSFSPGCAHQHTHRTSLRPRLESRCEQHMVPAFVILSAFGYEASVARD